ncbi:hypothetical protein AGLY_008784 [Aphis glycines]|uniref:Reverse transcriptase domain-containing protein n=1 Tax=Aphis glycines TaxID=307491 RepID=A0A6G0TK56_APHGL|nr:hypothetical protein AGLY_008784 [Aphis glycines]
MKFMQEEAIDVAILSDPYRICDNGCDSLADSALGRAAILVPGKQVTVCNVIRDAEFVSARVGGYQIYSCYATPNPATRDMFGSLLRRLENSVRTVMHDTPVVVAGDFNARSAAWGDRVTTSRGDELCDLLGSLQLIVLNEGSTPTFNRGEGSIIDVTAVSERVRCLTWSVLGDTFNNSDHNYIRFDLDSGTGIRRQNLCSSARGWDVTKGIDPELLEVGLLIAEWLSPVEDLNRRDAAHIADFFDCHVKTACDIVLRRKSAPNMARKPVHWWNPELSVLRSNCVSARRCKTRLAARHKRLQQRLGVTNPTVVQAVLDVDAADAQLRMCKKALKTAVARSKKACWDELVQSVESDPFGKPYKLVMRKLSGPPATDRMELDTLRSTIETLFPAGHPNIHGAVLPLEPFEAFTAEEVADVVTLFGSRRTAPGPDGIANLIIGSVHKARPDMLRHMYNRCLKEGVFPPRWKEARVVLLRKGDRPEGSVVGPLLWNAAYNSVLTTVLPAGAELIGFADDTLVVAHGKTASEVERIANEALDVVSGKIAGLGLLIAVEKTQAVLFTNKYKYTLPKLTINGVPITFTNDMLYLGMVVDRRLSFREHVQRAANKTAGIVTRLSRIMPNLGGPKECRRRLLVAVAHSVLLYGAPTWAHSLEWSKINANILNGAQRRALLRGICAYRTVSMTATNVLSAVPPADLIAREREMAFIARRAAVPRTGNEVTPRAIILNVWARRLVECEDGVWTRRLIPNVVPWCNRRHGQLEFHMTQIMSGHGCFGVYLHKIGKETTKRCHHCGSPEDDAAHTLFVCPAWELDRLMMTNALDVRLHADNFSEVVLSNPAHWEAVATFCRKVMKAKEDAERQRQQQAAEG